MSTPVRLPFISFFFCVCTVNTRIKIKMTVSAVTRKIKVWERLKFLILSLGDEGPVFAMCMTDRGDEATLNHWISGLQQKNAILGQVPTLFLLKGGTEKLQSSADREEANG